MKKILCAGLALAIAMLAACAASASEDTAAQSQTNVATPAPTTVQDVIASASADELREMIAQYNAEENYDLAYAAALRLIELDPSDTDAYTAAADALLAMSKANCSEINRLLAQGSENAKDAQDMVWWVKEHQSDLSFTLPFMPDYDSPDEINTEGITTGNMSNAMKQDGGWKAGLLTSQGDWTYLSRPDEGYAIYKMRADGSEYQRIGEDTGNSLNVIGDWLYYINLSDGGKPYKMRTDGKMKAKVSDDACEFMSVSGGWIYYNSLSNGGCLYKVKTDGSGQTKLTEEAVMVPCVSGDWVYFRHNNEAEGLWRVSVNGGEPQKVVDARLRSYCVIDDRICFVDLNEQFSVRRVYTDGTGYEMMYPCEPALFAINYADGILYLPYNETTAAEGVVTGRNLLVLDTATLTRLQEIELDIGPVYAGSKQMYFLKYSEGFAWYVMKPSGSIEKVG